MKRTLTEAQLSATQALKGDLAISAGAGSGKTTVLAHRFANGMLGNAKYNAPPLEIDQILTITFTKKAAAEIAERTRRQVSESVSPAAARRVDEAWISTIHRLCGRLVRRHVLEAAVEPGFGQADQVEAGLLMDDAFAAAASVLYDSSAEVAQLLDAYEYGVLGKATKNAHGVIRAMGLDPRDARVPGGAEELIPATYSAIDCADRLTEALAASKQTPAVVRDCQVAGDHAAALAACSLDGEVDVSRLGRVLDAFGLTARGDDHAKECLAHLKQAHLGVRSVVAGILAEPLLRGFELLLAEFATRFADAKRVRGVLDFDDLQEGAAALLAENPEIAKVYRDHFGMIMVDEFQDTNAMQMRVLENLRDDNLCAVGDENQSIYGFRDADVGIFRQVREASAQRIELKQNFRSHEEILKFINGLFTSPELFGADFMQLESGRDGKWRIPLAQGVPRVECLFVDTAEDCVSIERARGEEASRIAERISELVDSGAALGDIAVLVRAAGCVPIYASALEQAGHSVYVSAGQLFFNAPEVVEMLALLRSIALPSDNEALSLVLTSRLVGLSDDAMLALRGSVGSGGHLYDALEMVARKGSGAAALSEEQSAAATHAFDVISKLRLNQGEMRLSETVHAAAEGFDFDLTLLASGAPGTSAWANVLKIARFAIAFEEADSADLGSFIEHMRVRVEQSDSEGAAATDAGTDAVRIMTIHGAKGLEFPVVFVADLSGTTTKRVDGFLTMAEETPEGRRPVIGLKLPKAAPYNGVPTVEHTRLARRNALNDREEEKRCLYVACTRAEELLVISGARALSTSPGERYAVDWVRSSLGDPQEDGLVNVGGADVAVTVLRPDSEAEEQEPPHANGSSEPIFAAASKEPESATGDTVWEPESVSYTALNRYDACAFSYYVRHVLGMRWVRLPNEAGSKGVGLAFHQAMQAIVGGREPSDAVGAAALRHGLTTEEKSRLETAAGSFLKSQVAARTLAGERIATEQVLRVAVGDTWLGGSLDLIAWEGQTALIIDYKTGQAPDAPGGSSAHVTQSDCYALAALRAGAREVEVRFVFVEHDEVAVTFTYDASDAERIAASIEIRIDAIRRGEFPHLQRFDAHVCSDCPALGGVCPIDDPRPAVGRRVRRTN